MSPILIAGTIIVNLALIAYSTAIITEQRQKRVSNRVLTFLSIGVFLRYRCYYLHGNGLYPLVYEFTWILRLLRSACYGD